MSRFVSALISLLLLAVRAQAQLPSAPADLWLEDAKNPATQAWIAARNAETTAGLETDPRFERERQRLLALGGGSHSDRAAFAAYSPLQQLRAGVDYPEMLVTASGPDDRVHPGHARRFAERLGELGRPVLFRESTDTGHGAAAALDAAARQRALETTYLLQKLGLDGVR